MDVTEITDSSDRETVKRCSPQTDAQMVVETDLGEKAAETKSKTTEQRQQKQKQPQIKPEDQSKSIDSRQPSENVGKKSGPKRGEKKKKKKTHDLTDPAKIIESILDKSSFKVPNLSQQIEEKFYNTAHYNQFVQNELRDVHYLPTVGATSNRYSDIEFTLLPRGIQGQVNIPPMAMTSLNCIYQVPAKRVKFKRNKGGKQKQQVNSGAGNSKTTEQNRGEKKNESNGGMRTRNEES